MHVSAVVINWLLYYSCMTYTDISDVRLLGSAACGAAGSRDDGINAASKRGHVPRNVSANPFCGDRVLCQRQLE